MDETSGNIQSSSDTSCVIFSHSSAVGLDDEEVNAPEAAVPEVQVAVTSPFSGCFVVSVPLSEKGEMKVVRTLSKEKGCWGVTVMDENIVAVSVVDSGGGHIELIDMYKNIKWCLPLDCNTTSPLFLSPRHILTISPSSILVCDNGKKAVIQVTTDGNVLFTYTGYGNLQLVCPEVMCMDNSQDHVYIIDSADHSVMVLTKDSTLCSNTGSQQNDLNCPYAICMDKSGHLYVANDGGKLLTKLKC